MSFRENGAQQLRVSVLNRLKLAAKMTMYMLGGVLHDPVLHD